MGSITLRDSTGGAFDVPEEEAARYVARGYTLESPEQQAQRSAAEQQSAEFGGPVGTFAATGLGALRTVTGGLSDVALRGLGGQRELAALREENPYASTAGEIAGAFVPVGLPGVASRAGAALRAGEEAGVLSSLGRGAIAGAAEGAVYGAGAGVSELALSDDPLTVERAASVLSSNMLYGGALGGGIGLVGKAAELGLSKAKGVIDGAIARRAVEDGAPDLAALDNKGLKGAREVEIERIEAERAPMRRQVVEDIQDFRERGIEVNLGEGAKDLMRHGEVREANAAFRRANTTIRQALDNKAGLAERPQRVLDALQIQEQALATIKRYGEAASDAWGAEQRLIPEQIRSEILAGKVEGFVPEALTPRGVDSAVERVMLDRYGNLQGPEFPKSLRIIEDKYEGAIEANRKLQGRIRELTAEPTSERLAQIDSAKDALGEPRQKTLGEHLVGLVAPYAGPVGVIAAAGQKAVGGLRKAVGEAGARAGAAVSSFLDVATKAARRAPEATKVLAALSYATRADRKDKDEPTDLPGLYKRRTDEVKALTAFDETGVPRMLPEARAKVAERLKPVGADSPILADRLETIAARRIEYLSSIIPRRPDIAGAPIGPDRWQPSDLDMRSWARSAAAVDDPHGVLERAASGSVTPEDISALRSVYPELLAEFAREVASGLPELRAGLPQPRKLALSLITGVAVDPAMDPAILNVLQAQYQYEPATGGPRAQPQFGSVKNRAEVGTASQRREEGTV